MPSTGLEAISRCILKMNLAAFFPCLKVLSETAFTSNGLILLAGDI